MPARNIDEVLERLDAIVNMALRTDGRVGYFAALYLRVTRSVKRAIVAGDVFDDNERMDQLDTIFANRFLDAWQADADGALVTSPWALAFESLDRDDLMVVQHLALGMNAHINLDLGIAAAELMYDRDEPLEELKDDFDRINTVLARLTKVVQLQLGELSRTFDSIADVAPDLQALLFGRVLDAFREEAWSFAETLDATEDDEAYERAIEARSEVVEEAGKLILLPSDFSELVASIVDDEHLYSVRHNIQLLGE